MADGNSKKKRTALKSRARGSQMKTGVAGARKIHLSRLDLALMGKGPTDAAARRMLRDSAKGSKR